MKKVLKEANLNLESVTMLDESSCWSEVKRFEYLFTSTEPLKILPDTKIFIEVEESETMKEFLKDKSISKKDLVSWLNKNYK